MSFEVLDSTEEQTLERPFFLTVVCVLSFIGSGFTIFSNLIIILGVGTFLGTIPRMADMLNPGANIYLELAVFISVLSLIGSVKMWQLKKNGFYCYLFACIGSVLLPFLYGYGLPSIYVLVFVALFVVLYGMNLKHMR